MAIGNPAQDFQSVSIELEKAGYCQEGNFVCASCITLPLIAPVDDQPRALLAQIPEDEFKALVAEQAEVVARQGGWKCAGVYANYDAAMKAMKEFAKSWSEKSVDKQLSLRYLERKQRGFRYHSLTLDYPARPAV
eukprot:gb/GFBE01052865.1/.p1 GENE.gb/GFBE01052865.1/~~gb/GFBE01052865.1/.p1  ORF type:complete len:135 (+),score=26.82 gb/GFBE01052865.1/:1-405(+)